MYTRTYHYHNNNNEKVNMKGINNKVSFVLRNDIYEAEKEGITSTVKK